MRMPIRHPYAGRWIARINSNIIACGGTPEQVLRFSRAARYKEIPTIAYVPLQDNMIFPEIFYQLQNALKAEPGVYLVGGAVRDALLSLPIHDLDFVCTHNAKSIAKSAANLLHGDFYVMDETRLIFRVLIDGDENRILMDFAAIRGDTLEEDLKHRDFSINAIAVDLQDPQKLYDPSGGAQAIISKTLTMCSPGAMQDDPIRVVRGIRLAAQFGLKIEPATRVAMKSAVQGLAETTIERIREEVFKIADLAETDVALKALSWLGCDSYIFTVLDRSAKTEINDQQKAAIQIVNSFRVYLDSLICNTQEEIPQDAISAIVRTELLEYRPFLMKWYEKSLHPDRSRRSMLVFALIHLQVHISDSHADVPYQSGVVFHLSNPEKNYLKKLSNGSVQLLEWNKQNKQPSNREKYRFFREFGEAGVDACIAALAVVISQSQNQLINLNDIADLLNIVSNVLKTYRDEYKVVIDPPVLMDGDELMRTYQLPPGPLVGEILELVREKQAAEEIRTKEDIPPVVVNFLNHKNNQG